MYQTLTTPVPFLYNVLHVLFFNVVLGKEIEKMIYESKSGQKCLKNGEKILLLLIRDKM